MGYLDNMTDKECPTCYAPLFCEESDDPIEDDLYVCHRCGWAGFDYEC